MLSKTEYVSLIRDALQRKETVVIGAYCTVRYSGRAESFLTFGDRLIIVKSDSVLLVHQPQGNMPVNYTKPETNILVSVEKGNLVIQGHQVHAKERLIVIVERVYFFNTHNLQDGAAIVIQGTEKDMSDMLYNNPELVEQGFTPVSREEQTKYGFIDVFGTDSKGLLTVVECKRYCADLSAVTQLRRYVEKIKKSKGVPMVRGILAAPKITANAEKMLADWGFSFRTVTPPRYLEEFDRAQTRLENF